MTPPPLEDRLNRLADGLVAPPTPEARDAIGHRTGVLRRRRRARQAAGVGALVLAAVAGSIAVTRDTAPEARSGYAGLRTPGRSPALTLDIDGWEVVYCRGHGGRVAAPALSERRSVQVFQPGRATSGRPDHRAPALDARPTRSCPSTGVDEERCPRRWGHGLPAADGRRRASSSGGRRPLGDNAGRDRGARPRPGRGARVRRGAWRCRDDDVPVPATPRRHVRLRGHIYVPDGLEEDDAARVAARRAGAGPAPRRRECLGEGRAHDRGHRATSPTGPP